MKITLAELLEKMEPQNRKDKALMQRCIKGLALYAGQHAQANPSSAKVTEMRSLVENIACYWGLDDGNEDKLQNEFMKPFDDAVSEALDGKHLGAAIASYRASTIHGLYRFGTEMIHCQGIESKDNILAMGRLMRELATSWDFESDLLDNLANDLKRKISLIELDQSAPDMGGIKFN